MLEDLTIPQPIAPARPISSPIGSTTPANYNINGQTGTGVIDAHGNIFDNNGTLVLPGQPSQTNDAPSGWDMLNPFSTKGADNSGLKTSVNDIASTVTDAATRSIFGISLIDGVAILIGIILIIGALYTFGGTKEVITTATKAVKTAAAAAA